MYNGAYYPTGCWGTHRTGSNGYALLFTGNSVSATGSQSAATQLPVRCVQDATIFGVGTPIMEAVIVSDISATGATFNCRMTSTGGATIVERGFYYHTQSFVDGVGAKLVKALQGVNEPAFSAGVTGLTQSTTYYVRAYIRTSGGTFYTPLVQFVPSGLPQVSTDNATSTGSTTATVGGTVIDMGGDATVKRGVVYSTTSNFDPQSQDTQVEAGTTGSGSYNVSLTGLQPGTVYYVRAYATNKIATAYGVQRGFTTVGVPTLTAPSLSDLLGTTVTFNSTLTGPLPTPGVTEWGFEWSTSADFPAGAGTASAVVPDSSHPTGKSFVFPATGLTDNTTYYVRAYGVNTAGKGYSASLRFVTPQLPSVVTLVPGGGTSLGGHGNVLVTFNGEVTAIGAGTSVTRGFEFSTTAGFAPGTGSKVSAGSSAAGRFAVSPRNSGFESDRTYYIRAYATNSAGTGYGEIRSVRVDYVPPTFNGVTLTITERRINALRASMSGTPQLGNAEVHYQGFAYQEEGSSSYIYSTSFTPPLKVYKKYTVYAYVRNFKGTYYSPASASETTYKNYFTRDGQEYVVDARSGEGYAAWATGAGSLVGRGNDNELGGYYQTKKLVERDNWDFHPRAAKFCWDKPPVHNQQWFLGTWGILTDLFNLMENNPTVYDPALRHQRETYWSSTEESSMTGITTFWSNVFDKFLGGELGKNDKRLVRCIRVRDLPADEYAD